MTATAEGKRFGEGRPHRVGAEEYWRAIPRGLRNRERYYVQRTIKLHLGKGDPDEDIRVYEGDVLVRANDVRHVASGGDNRPEGEHR